MEENEGWRPVRCCDYGECYEVSNLGRVKRIRYWDDGTRKPGLLSPWKNGEGYMLVQLSRHGIKKIIGVHQLVMMAFVGPYPERMEVNHIDTDKTNNRLTNLEYGTGSHNRLHAFATGLAKPTIERRVKVKEADIRVIRRLKGQVRVVEIAKWYGLSRKTIYGILRRERWKHVA